MSSPQTSSPGNQVVSQVSNASRILRARGTLSTPKALNLRQVSDLIQYDRDIPTLARDLIWDLINFTKDQDTDAILAQRELHKKDVLLNNMPVEEAAQQGIPLTFSGSRDSILFVLIDNINSDFEYSLFEIL